MHPVFVKLLLVSCLVVASRNVPNPSPQAEKGATCTSVQGCEPKPLVPHLLELKHLQLCSSQLTKKDMALDPTPQVETPPAISDASPDPLLSKPPGATLQADRVVRGVPGHIANVGQPLLGGGVGGNALEGVLAQVPLPLDDVQDHRHVPLLVEEELVAKECEVDMPDLVEKLEGSGRKISRAGTRWDQTFESLPRAHPHTSLNVTCLMGALETWNCQVVTLEPSLELGLSPATLALCNFSPVAQPL